MSAEEPRREAAAEAKRARAEISALLESLYEAISGPPGPRDWKTFAAGFAEGATLVVVKRTEKGKALERHDIHSYVASRSRLFSETAFYEYQVDLRIVRFGDLAHAWSAYEARYALDGPAILRGLNSYQLWHGESGWRILSLVWEHHRPGLSWPGGEEIR